MGTSRRGPQSRYQRLEEEMERSNQGYIDQQQRQQQVNIANLNCCIFCVWCGVITKLVVVGYDGETR